MFKVYMVFINNGFGGVKYFQKEKNAKNYIEKNGGNLEVETVTTKEYCSLDFSDPIEESYF